VLPHPDRADVIANQTGFQSPEILIADRILDRGQIAQK